MITMTTANAVTKMMIIDKLTPALAPIIVPMFVSSLLLVGSVTEEAVYTHIGRVADAANLHFKFLGYRYS